MEYKGEEHSSRQGSIDEAFENLVRNENYHRGRGGATWSKRHGGECAEQSLNSIYSRYMCLNEVPKISLQKFLADRGSQAVVRR